MLLHEKLKPYRLILASQSPRRRELLAGSGLEFELAPRYVCEENYPADLYAKSVPRYLAELKSHAYPEELGERDILLTADTVVLLGERILGKPATREEAIAMLRDLSGRSHTVVTGVMFRSATKTLRFSAESEVWFRTLRDEEIEYYVDTFRPMDKAGSYGIQEWIGFAAIERINGSFFNVMGLPIQRVYTELEQFLEEEYCRR